jgi:peptidoglycan/LPS O-acetylase OafA/YrhL
MKAPEPIGGSLTEPAASAGPTTLVRALGHIPALDGVRGVAVLLVLLFHGHILRYVEPGGSPVDAVFLEVAQLGWMGVDLFFVLSGFLITGILYETRTRPRYFRNFYLRRTVRIFPLYYATLVLLLMVLPNLPAGWVPPEKVERLLRVEGEQWWFWLYLSNVATAIEGAWVFGVLDIAWSLSIEEQFYVFWPFFVLRLNRRQLMRLCGAAMVVALIVRLVLTLKGTSPVSIYVLTPARMDLLLAGGWVALAARGPGGVRGLLAPAVRAFAGSSVALCALTFWRGGFDNMDPVMQTAGFSLLAVQLSALLVFAVALPPHSRLVRALSWAPLRLFGKYSYAMYLFHLPLIALVRDAVYGREQFLTLAGARLPGQLLFYAMSTALIFGAAALSWHCFEKHWLKLKRFAQ